MHRLAVQSVHAYVVQKVRFVQKSCFRIVACRYSCGVVVVRVRFEGVVLGAHLELFDEDCGLRQHSKTAV